MRQTTRKQHFVPKFYLKRFADDNGRISVLDLKRQKVVKPVPFGSVCWRNYFYAVEEGHHDDESQETEFVFQQIEDSIAKDWDGTITRAKNGELRQQDYINIASLSAMLMLRTKASRDNFNRNLENLDKARLGLILQNESFDNPATVAKYRKILQKQASVEELKSVQQTLVNGEYSLTYNNVPFMRFLLSQLEGFFNILISQRWTVYQSTAKQEFITSENPVVEWTPKQKGFFATPRLRYHQFIAIAPEIMIKMEPPPLPDPFPEPDEEFPEFPLAWDMTRYKKSSETDVTVYNFLLTGRGSSFAYARRRLELDTLIDEHSTSGPLKRLYSLALAT